MATEGIERNLAAHVNRIASAIVAEVGRAYFGQAETTEILLTALLARGHVLLEGVPGIAKTTLVKAFSRTLGATFKRIQFTPDLLPSDITGTYILDMRTSSFVLREGPIFAHVILGDEINRAPAKTQSALLEAMQERQVTIDGETLPLPSPMIVLATQNPIEQEGTYPLPEAQVDRFLIKLTMRYPSPSDEKRMLATCTREVEEVRPVIGPADLAEVQKIADHVHVEEDLLDYVLGLVQHSRRHRRVYLGASPRAALGLVQAAKAHALLKGRDFVLPDDIKYLAPHVLSHRILLLPEADLEGLLPEAVVAEALESIPYRKRR
ncbi:MAG: MoxR family ATPase [Deltaproteobacteria bacterium]|nr:MoxR family ATPase [Deltaproteobacteria bacterium]